MRHHVLVWATLCVAVGAACGRSETPERGVALGRLAALEARVKDGATRSQVIGWLTEPEFAGLAVRIDLVADAADLPIASSARLEPGDPVLWLTVKDDTIHASQIGTAAGRNGHSRHAVPRGPGAAP